MPGTQCPRSHQGPAGRETADEDPSLLDLQRDGSGVCLKPSLRRSPVKTLFVTFLPPQGPSHSHASASWDHISNKFTASKVLSLRGAYL